ncbi:Rok-like winged helix domain-containing protein [Priestia megaterium]|uniref:Rok-like winged helix domain-containing protein n=1 Tax=Priestia megaterium TaxID=1404 RepID=UPI002079F427|nr:hypothetical protein [Priestia megaterium]USL39636.1 hypothetical protein LIT34_30705 [Priestia megaterium]
MRNEKEYWKNRLKELNKEIIELNIERRNVRRQLTRLEKNEQSPVPKEDMKHRTTVETVCLLTSHPSKVFASKEILEHLHREVGYTINNFAPVYRYVKEVEPNIVQVRRGYYMYKP